MKVKMILPALTEAKSPYWRPIKYSLFPPLGLATLAGYLREDDEVTLTDEHVEELSLDDAPDLVVLQAYVTSARRAYRIADHYRRRGVRVVIGGLSLENGHSSDSGGAILNPRRPLLRDGRDTAKWMIGQNLS